MENEQRYFEMTSSGNKLLRTSFLYMIFGLLVTFLVPAYILFFNNNLINFIIRGYYFILIAEIVLVMVLSARIEKISPMSAKILFFTYSILNGLVFSIIGLVIGDLFLIGYTLAITVVMFTLLAIYGYTTKEDLTNYGGYLKTGLLTLIIVSLINIFLKAPMLYWIVSIAGVVIFSALTVYDVSKIKQLAYNISDGNPEMMEKLGIIGALELYLDFINLFLYLLRIFSRKKN